MKTLILVRHAQSGHAAYSQKDISRTLTQQGKRDATAMAQVLKKKNLIPQKVISSPAERAMETAKIFMDEMALYPSVLQIVDSLSEPVIKNFYDAIEAIQSSINTALICSHNPAITLFINDLDCQKVFDMPPCGVYAIKCDAERWEDFQNSEKSFVFYGHPQDQ